ncbi:MAG: transcriptional regulator [Bacilli bacterium]
MEKFVLNSLLMDVYKDLITENNYIIFNYYYTENYTLQEIADLLNVSKSFIGLSIKNTEKKLNQFENSLHIVKTNNELREILEINDIDEKNKRIKKLLDEE